MTRAILAGVVLAAALAAPAGAQPAKVQAEEQYNTGRGLMKAGKIAEACAAFAQSQKLDPAATTLIALATCRDKLGQLATALELFREAERQTALQTDDTAVQLHQLALARAAALEPRVPKLTIHVPEGSQIPGLEILRDLESIPAEMWNRDLPINGGTYAITARAPSMTAWSARVTLANEADTKTIDVPDLRSLPKTPEEPAPPPPAPTSRPSRALPLAVGAGSVALFGGALGFVLWGNSTYDKAKAEVMDPVRRYSLEVSANRKLYTAEGLTVASMVGAGVAFWLFVRQRGRRPERATAQAGRWMLTPSASGIGVAGRF